MARIVLPETPHHVVQRGHNRSSVFTRTDDFQRFLDNLAECKELFGIRVYAWCLMTNHVHLILEPGSDATTLGKLMRRLAGRQTRFVNSREGRTGTLWEGRYRSSPIQTDRYLLACSRYIELNPVRARMADHPSEYRWSSYREKTGRIPRGWLDEDPCYNALGECRDACEERYAAFVDLGIRDAERAFIAESVRRNLLTGDGDFVEHVEHRIGRRVERRGQGRPSSRGSG